MSDVITGNFTTRYRKLMMILLNVYIRCKIEGCCVVWSPRKNAESDKLQRYQKHFTAEVERMERINYHERPKEPYLYSLKRGRKSYMIIQS